VRTTLTLDDDVAAKLAARARKTGESFRAVVNDALRRGLATTGPRPERRPFQVRVRDLGAVRPGLQFDDIAGLLEQVEGPLHR
jgi:plasmid stability protein